MKKFKLFLWAVLVALAVVLFFENKDFFLAKNVLVLDLKVIDPLKSIELYNAIWILGALCVGFLIAYFFALIEKFKTGRIIKGLKAELVSQTKKITQLEKELSPRSGYSADDVVDSEPVAADAPPASEKI